MVGEKRASPRNGCAAAPSLAGADRVVDEQAAWRTGMSAADIDQPHDAVRRTALVLHALAPADRDWVLGRLPERNRAQVVPCLEELATLGIPQDANLVDVALPAKRKE